MQNKSLHLDVNEQIECAHTLASRFYTDPSILEIEKSKIFRGTWQLAGTLQHACGEVNGVKRTIADPETFFTAEVAGEPIVVVRDKQGTLRAYSNVCRHRAGPIAQGSGCKNVLRCGYHGWTYTLDGRLIGTPDVEGVEFFDRSTMGMVPLRLETWEQLIFVNLNSTAEPLSAYLGDIPEQARGFQFEGLQSVERRDYIIVCNWRVYVDNISMATIKPEDAAERERFYPPGIGLLEALYFWIFPNLMLNIYPDNLSTNLIVPLSHDKIFTIFEWFFHDAHSEKVRERIQRAIAFSDEVQQEDIDLCRNVQRGLNSSTYDRGRYSVKRENGVHHFHMLLSEFLSKP